MGYDYAALCRDIEKLNEKYDMTDIFSIGKSVMGKDIYCIKTGNGKKRLFIGGAYHGLEYLTSLFLMRFIDRYIRLSSNGSDFFGFDTDSIYNAVTMFIVPMVNPDGVDIAVNGLDINNPYHRRLTETAGIHEFSHVWQANARGVDINHNFDADWKMTVPYPSPTKYGGKHPGSEPETRAVTGFIQKSGIDMLIAFHSQGGEIYYGFMEPDDMISLPVAKKLADISGYDLALPCGTASYGGCKDWFVKEFKKPGFTVEMGRGKNPLPENMIDDVFWDNAKIILCAANELMHSA